jgi:phosphoribosylamine--glycine ligase
MRFLGIGETNELGDMYLRLMKAGHEVRVHMSDSDSAGVMEGMLKFVGDWRDEIDWVRSAGSDGIVLFETASDGETQDALRRQGLNVIGGSGFGDKLENDRAYGQQVLRDLGLQVAASYEFNGLDEAIERVTKFPARYVFKLSGSDWSSTRTYVGVAGDGRDMLSLLNALRRNRTFDELPCGVLMEFVEGVEVGVGAFFNGKRFLSPPNLDWEHKRFFPGNIGELTGEMGTVVTYRGAGRIFDATLAKLGELLSSSGYCGYINLNTVVNEKGIWPLELTSRFGYPGFPILGALHEEGWDSIFAGLAGGHRDSIRTRDGFSIGVVLTVPSFPYAAGYDRTGKGMPIVFRDDMNDDDRDSLHFGEVSLDEGQLVTAGMIGYVMVVTGTGLTVAAARRDVYDRVAKVIIPNMRYRNDIGSTFDADCATLRRLGWLEC